MYELKFTVPLVLLLLLFWTTLFSQSKNLIIADSINRHPLPYATVKALNSTRGYYSDKNGMISIPIFENDSLLVEYVGYISNTFRVNNYKDTIFLHRREYELTPVEIKSKKIIHKIGSLKYAKRNTIFLSASIEYALKIDMSEINGNYYKVQQMVLPLSINEKTFKDCIVKFHLYDEAKDGRPGEEMLVNPVFLTIENHKKKRFYVDVSTHNIFTNSKYLFIGIECIMDKVSMQYNLDLTRKKSFKQQSNLSPISLYISKEKSFFDGGFGHTFTRFLNSRLYKWDANIDSKNPINFAGGVIVSSSL